MKKETKKDSLFGKIISKDEAIKVIKSSFIGLLIISIIQIILGFYFDSLSIVIDGIIFLILAVLVKKFKSRISAIILLILSLITLVSNFIFEDGGSKVLSFILIYLGIRIVQATFKYNQKEKDGDIDVNTNKNTIDNNNSDNDSEKKEDKENEDTIFFKKNVLNWEFIEINGGILPLQDHNVGMISINNERKTVEIELRQVSTKSVNEKGTWYQVPYYGFGHMFCENINYKIVNTDINGPVFILTNDKKNPKKLKLMLNHNRKGIEILCDKISILDFNEVQLDDIQEYTNIENGCKIGKFFTIKNSN